MAAQLKSVLPTDVAGRDGGLLAADLLNSPRPNNRIVQSPYTEDDHLLDLDTLDHENRLLAQALAQLKHIRDDYATAPYVESFNWDAVMSELTRLAREHDVVFRETSFYIVAFRSQLKPGIDSSHLGALDKASHAEAVASGGFLK